MAERVVCVTGASGFVGRHVVRALLHAGANVTAVSRQAHRLEEFAGKAVIVEFDLANPGVGAFDRLGRPDVLLHLAWEGLPNYRSLHHFETELPRQYAFLKSMVDDGLKTVVVTGTCFEYGMQDGPLSEAHECRASTPYAFAKDSLRRQLDYLRGLSPFNLVWARLFYLFGEGQARTSLWSQLASALDRGDARFPMSEGDQLRDFMPALEAGETLARLALRGGNAGLVNICSGRPRSVRSMVESWAAERRAEIEFERGRYPYPDYEPMAFWGVRGKLDELLRDP